MPVLEIARAMEQACPEAWFINFTNPMVRICDLVNRHTKIKAVGLCHQILIGYCFVGMMLSKELGIEIPEGITGMQADVVERDLRGGGYASDIAASGYPGRRHESFYMDSFHS